jgi:hypothetical protein
MSPRNTLIHSSFGGLTEPHQKSPYMVRDRWAEVGRPENPVPDLAIAPSVRRTAMAAASNAQKSVHQIPIIK